MGAARQAKRPKRSEVKRVENANPCYDAEPLGVGVDTELDRGMEFSRIDLCMGIRPCQVGDLIPA